MLKSTARTCKPIAHTSCKAKLHVANSPFKERMQKAAWHAKSHKNIFFGGVVAEAVRDSLCEVGEKSNMYNSLKNCEC